MILLAINEVVDKFIFFYLQEELEALRAKFEKVDKERQELKQHNEKLDSRVSFSLFIFTHFLLVNCNFPNG